MSKEQRMHVLIVDDSEDDRHIAKRILEKDKFKVSEAGDWMDALGLIGKGGIDLVLLDLRMPDMDGMELLGIIRKENSKINLPVIIYSSYEVGNAENKSEASGFIDKYGEPEDLIKKVKSILKMPNLQAV